MPRASGEGSIYQRSDGRWVAQYKPRGRPRRYRYRKSRAAAVIALRELIREAEAYIRPGLKSFEVYAGQWLEQKRLTRRRSTYNAYDGLLRNYILPVFGKVKLPELQPADFTRLYTRMAKTVGPKTVTNAHRLVHTILQDAYRSGEVVRNAADLVSPPPFKKYIPQVLSVAQARRLLDKAQGTRLEAFWWLGIQGMRSGEICALKWDSVDLAGQKLRIERNFRRVRGGWELDEPKTRRSRRELSLAPPTIDALHRRYRLQLEERLRAGPEWQGMDFVFTRENGEPMRQDQVLNVHFRPMLKAAGFPPSLEQMRVHDLRHSLVALLLAAGVDIATISEILGHSSPDVTMRIYAHMLPGMDGVAVDKLSGLNVELNWQGVGSRAWIRTRIKGFKARPLLVGNDCCEIEKAD